MSDVFAQLCRERDSQLEVAFDKVHQAGWPISGMYLQNCEIDGGQATSIMLCAWAFLPHDTEVFRVMWRFDETGMVIIVTPLWLRDVPECPPRAAEYFEFVDETRKAYSELTAPTRPARKEE